MTTKKESAMSQPKTGKQGKRRGGLLRLRLRGPVQDDAPARGPDLGDLRLQFLLGAWMASR
jgi:hypothetical protein